MPKSRTKTFKSFAIFICSITRSPSVDEWELALADDLTKRTRLGADVATQISDMRDNVGTRKSGDLKLELAWCTKSCEDLCADHYKRPLQQKSGGPSKMATSVPTGPSDFSVMALNTLSLRAQPNELQSSRFSCNKFFPDVRFLP